MKKKILIILFLMFLFIGVRNIKAAVVCKYGEFEIDFVGYTATGGSLRPEMLEWKIQKNGAYVDAFDIDFSPNFSSSQAENLIKNNDISICAKRVYIYEIDYDTYFSYEVDYSQKKYDDCKEYIVDLTDSYCTDCQTYPDLSKTEYTNYTKTTNKICGDGVRIPAFIPSIVSKLYTLIQILVPVVLVILGTIDLLKGITAGKEDEIRKAQQTFFKRVIAAILVFFVLTAVKFTLSLVTKKSKNLLDCVNCVIKDKCEIEYIEYEKMPEETTIHQSEGGHRHSGTGGHF